MENTKYNPINDKLITFLNETPNAYFAVKNIKQMLSEAGYTELFEGQRWELERGGNYYVTRDGSSLIAFRIPEREFVGFQIMASHGDSPAFKVKPNAAITVEDSYRMLNTEPYGGMILYTWLDRPLSVAGRLVVRTEDGIETRLVNLDRDLVLIPSLAIHMERKLNDGYVLNRQTDMLPLFAQSIEGTTEGGRQSELLTELIARETGMDEEDILGSDLFLYNRQQAVRYGADGEFIGSSRLDDLQCAFASLMGLLEANPGKSAAVCCIFNNEEVGSSTKQGAASSFLEQVLGRIIDAFGDSREALQRALVSSFMVSADNAHAIHPNHREKADPTNRPLLNGGIVIKHNANQHYTTDAVSCALFQEVCKRAKVPVQHYVNRSDIAGGSTLGSIASTRVSMNTVDIGLPQLSMHSAFETAGVRDTAYLAAAARELFSCSVSGIGDGTYRINSY